MLGVIESPLFLPRPIEQSAFNCRTIIELNARLKIPASYRENHAASDCDLVSCIIYRRGVANLYQLPPPPPPPQDVGFFGRFDATSRCGRRRFSSHVHFIIILQIIT